MSAKQIPQSLPPVDSDDGPAPPAIALAIAAGASGIGKGGGERLLSGQHSGEREP
jgi:hypothetical protein